MPHVWPCFHRIISVRFINANDHKLNKPFPNINRTHLVEKRNTPPILYIVAWSHSQIFFGFGSLHIMTEHFDRSITFPYWINAIFPISRVCLTLPVLASLRSESQRQIGCEWHKKRINYVHARRNTVSGESQWFWIGIPTAKCKWEMQTVKITGD